MNSILTSIISVFFTIPLLGFLLIFLLSRLITKSSRKSIHKALDYSTILFIFSVHFLITVIYGKSLFWLIILIMILIAMMFSIIHWKMKSEIVFSSLLKGIWRFNFLFFFFAYLALTILGLVRSALHYTLF